MPKRIVPTKRGDVLILWTAQSFSIHAVGKVINDGQQDFTDQQDAHHLPDRAAAVAEARTLVAPGRRIFLQAFDTGDWSEVPSLPHDQRTKVLTDEEIMDAAMGAAKEFGLPYNDPFEVATVTRFDNVVTVTFTDKRVNLSSAKKLFSVDLQRAATIGDVRLQVRERLNARTGPF